MTRIKPLLAITISILLAALACSNPIKTYLVRQTAVRETETATWWTPTSTATAILTDTPAFTSTTTPAQKRTSTRTPRPTKAIDISFPAREMGDPEAKVIVDEFADFQCPACGHFFTNTEYQLREQYIKTGKIRFIFRNFPVVDDGSSSGESHLAALAALCAGEQGKFWEYHDFLFRNQHGENRGNFASAHLSQSARNLGLDGPAFDQCLGEQRYLNILEADIELGDWRGVNGTPTLFVNNEEVIIQSQDYQELYEAIDSALMEDGD